MTNKIETLDNAALNKAAERITAYDAGCRFSFKSQMGYAFLAGLELIRVKENLPHGEFDKFLKAHLPELKKNSQCRYMAFATALKPQILHSAIFDADKLLTAGKEIPEPMREEIGKAVYKIADGKSLTEMYRDLGVIRQKEKPKHTPPKPQTPEEKLAAKREAADGAFDRFIAAAHDLAVDETYWNSHTTPGKRDEARDAALLITTKARKKN